MLDSFRLVGWAKAIAVFRYRHYVVCTQYQNFHTTSIFGWLGANPEQRHRRMETVDQIQGKGTIDDL